MIADFLRKIKDNKDLQVFLLIFSLAAILRFLFLTSQGFWYDEALTALSMKMSFFDMIRDRLSGGHSPLYFIVIYPFAKLFGASELIVRLPSVIASVISIYVFYLLAGKLFNDSKIVNLSTLFFSLSALNIYFAQEARMYSMCVLAIIASFYFLLRAIDEEDWKLWAGYVISTAILFYLSASSIPVIFVQIAYVMIKRRKLADFFLSFSIIVLLYVPMAYFYLSMKKLGFIEWLPPINLQTFLNIFYGFGFKSIPILDAQGLYAMYVPISEFLSVYLVGAIIIFGILFSFIRISKSEKGIRLSLVSDFDSNAALFLILWLALPIIIEVLYSIFKQPMFGPKRYVIILSPAYYLLLGLGIKKIGWKWLKNSLAAVLLVFFTLALFTFYSTPTKEDWIGAISFIDKNVAPEEIVVGDLSTSTMYKYYGKREDLIIVNTKYIYSNAFGPRWLLLRTRDFNTLFGAGISLKKNFKAEEIKGFW